MKRSAILLFLAVSAPLQSANAQTGKQTVEGAQRFLKIQFDGGVSVTTLFPSGKRVLSRIKQGQDISLSDRSAECKTIYYTAIDGETQVEAGEYDWPNTLAVKQDGSEVAVTYRVNVATVWTDRLEFNSEDLAARVAYAMEFLRVACDPASETGF